MTWLRTHWRAVLVVLAVVLVPVGVVLTVGWYKLFRQVPLEYESDERYFKYGSIGTEEEAGIPYWVWAVLPHVFPEHLPGQGGYASFGFVWEEGEEMPIGFCKRTIGFPRVGINCAACHTSTARARPGDPPHVYLAATSGQVDVQGYLNFLFACAADPRFTPDVLLQAIEYQTELSWLDRQLYRRLIIPKTREALLKQKEAYAWTVDAVHKQARWGRGRIDPFNPVKFGMLGMTPDHTIGNSDMMPIWDLGARRGKPYHWDGLNDDLREVTISSALGDGATPKTLPLEHLKRLEAWLEKLPAPANPFLPPRTKWTEEKARLWERGKEVFDDPKRGNCAECHAPGGKRAGTLISQEEVGTDRHRLEMWTQEAADRYNRHVTGYGGNFAHFRSSKGYVAVPLDGLWLRAPYLHNGSVPNLRALLEPSDNRPAKFHRGSDVYDADNGGFVSSGPEAERAGSPYDTRVPGNGNGGHPYGTDLPADDRRALLEYLKTL